ncbi:hypothetical protein L596_027946 [Steinernema carpocapsae]|uniref:Uncharacterized protein n=1 Tax=Steinernema carpocapsae TaxID=34508 RepID=A0A4U5LX08_STECR|nr:hypothetical protein L596_027946 [Steinernema carpocapsae]
MRKTIPPVPDPFNIPDDLCLTLGREDEVEAFVMVSNEAERTLIFAADSLLEIAAQSDMIIGDGTFQHFPDLATGFCPGADSPLPRLQRKRLRMDDLLPRCHDDKVPGPLHIGPSSVEDPMGAARSGTQVQAVPHGL